MSHFITSQLRIMQSSFLTSFYLTIYGNESNKYGVAYKILWESKLQRQKMDEKSRFRGYLQKKYKKLWTS